jgi:dihydroxyacetone kinase-like protein
MAGLDSAEAIRVLTAVCDRIEASKDYLCELDAALGDGDHGISMAKSFHAVRVKLGEVEGQELPAVLNAVGMTLIAEVGGAMGPLFGTAFIRAGKSVAGKTELTSADLAAMLAAAEAGIVQRGKAQPGDKTMLDAVHAAVVAAEAAAASGASLFDTLRAAADGAEQGAASTRDMVAKVGRASRLGERTLGCQDAGATSTAIILRTAVEAVAAQEQPG